MSRLSFNLFYLKRVSIGKNGVVKHKYIVGNDSTWAIEEVDITPSTKKYPCLRWSNVFEIATIVIFLSWICYIAEDVVVHLCIAAVKRAFNWVEE